MNNRFFYRSVKTLCRPIVVGAVLCALALPNFAQTAADTNIKNQASATYSDGTNSYSSVSNEVTVTVAKVAGLTITPDGQTNSTVVAGQTNVPFTFRVTNVGNFTDQVRFLANGASVRVTGAATVASATAGSTDILTNGTDVLQSLTQNGFVDVTVNLNISSSAAAAGTIQVFLGDAASGTNFDNITATNSANEVRTVSTGAVNGSREARGDISVVVDNNGQIRANLTAPAGPVALGSNITYSLSVCNDGQRTLSPVGTDPSIYAVAPIPAGTQLASGQTFATGTQFTISPLSTSPLAAAWTNSAPSNLATVTRIRIPVATSLTAGVCSSLFNFDVTVMTTNANTSVYEIIDAFAVNSVNATVTDQSGDSAANRGDGNADFDEPLFGGTVSGTQGFQLPTTLQKAGGVFLGPNGAPQATGPTSVNDDYTNRSVTTGIAAVAPGGATTAGGTVTFTNSVQNTGNADDTYTLTAPTVPTGFTVEISTDGGTSFTTVSGGGSKTIAVSFGQTAGFQVKVTAPSGQTVLTGYDTVIRATSVFDTTKVNDTIDRVYTGFVRLDKSYVIDNQTGVGGATDAVPGADIVYTVTYTNVSSTGGSGSLGLTAGNLVITEDGAADPNGDGVANNWGTTTTRVAGQEFDYSGSSGTTAGSGTVNVVSASSYTDAILTLAPGSVGRFVFKRKIN